MTNLRKTSTKTQHNGTKLILTNIPDPDGPFIFNVFDDSY